MSRREIGQPFRADVEGLRALAAGLVVAFHARVPHVTGGFIGVDVFFVISGYLITGLLARELEQTGDLEIAAFVARRIRRLLPATVTVLVGTLALASIVQPPLQLIRTAESVRAAFAYSSNVHFLRLSSDYFNGNVRSDPTLHMWSLGVEEQFYLVWPWIVLWCGGSTKGLDVDRRRLAWCLVALAMVSFIGACWLTTTNRSLAFYGTPLRAWEFAIGGLISLPQLGAKRGHDRHDSRWLTLVGWLGVALIAGAAVSYSALTEFPGATALVPVLGTAVLLYQGASECSAWGPGRLLASAPMRWVGRRSYSWYLWHWPLLALTAAVAATGGLFLRVSVSLSALCLAELTYRWVEQPLRVDRSSRGPGPVNAWLTIRLGVLATVALVTLSTIVRRAASSASNSPAQRAYTAAASDIAKPYGDGCVSELTDDRVHACVYGAVLSPTTVALFGDSHAAQWFPALESIARDRRWKLLLVAKNGCAAADVPVYDPETGQRSLSCERWREAAMDTILAHHVTLVLTANSVRYVQRPGMDRETRATPVAVWEEGLVRTLSELRAHGVRAAIILDTPHLRANVPVCLARSGLLGHLTGTCATDRADALRQDVAVAEQDVAGAILDRRVVDMTDRLCTATICSPTIGGIIAYSDNEHLSATMVRSLTHALSDALGAVGL